jgi:Fe-S cluster biosynthesis and repair protein YggX
MNFRAGLNCAARGSVTGRNGFRGRRNVFDRRLDAEAAFMAERMVKCVKFQKELQGLDEPPWSGELGKRIYENVSQQAWDMWLEHLKMVINEYRLSPATREAQEIIEQQMEQFFFGEGAALPPGYVPPQKKA